jgi:hypothetical protein
VASFPQRRSPNKWVGFDVVDVDRACDLTGLALDQLLGLPGVEQLTRIRNGETEQAVRIPSEILEAATTDPSALKLALSEVMTSDDSHAELRARIRAIIEDGQPSG